MKLRNLFAAAAALAVLLIFSPPGWAMDPEAVTLLEKVQKLYAGAVGFRAHYTLTFEGGSVAGTVAETKTTTGVMLYGSPDRLRLIQESPLEEEMVIAPSGIWWYVREDNEAHRYPASEFYDLFSPIMSFFKVIGDFKTLDKAFRVTRHVGADKGKEKAVKLVPLSHGTGLDWLVVWVDSRGSISRVAIHVLNGDSNTYQFDSMEILSEEPGEGFGFTPPAGARIVHH